MPDQDDEQQTSNDQTASQSDQSGAASSSGDGGDRAAARAARGLPDSIDQLTDAQRHEYIGQPTVDVEAENADEVEVLAMQDTGSDSGEAVA